MQINPVKIFNFNTSSIKPAFIGQTRYANLAPLNKDTVIFKGKISTGEEKKISHSDRPRITTADKIYEDSDYAYGLLKYAISKALDMSVIDINSHNAHDKIIRTINGRQHEPVVLITGRRKSSESIAEKMASQKLKGIDETKETLNDLIGVRIILSGKSTEEGEYVLDKLGKAVQKKRIKIKEIKNHGQNDPKLNYVSKKGINKFLKIARNEMPMCKYTDEPRNSGYLAVHILTDEIFDGYNAEIQIIGLDVSELKEIEDLCYKCLAGKNIPEKYSEIAKRFQPLREDESLKNEYMEYTKKAYAKERKRPMHKAKASKKFLSIPKNSRIPKNLDFNQLSSAKLSADIKEGSR